MDDGDQEQYLNLALPRYQNPKIGKVGGAWCILDPGNIELYLLQIPQLMPLL